MAEVEADDGQGVEVVPLRVGENRYAVRLDRIAAAMQPSDVGDVAAGDTFELSDHQVVVSAAADLLGEEAREESALLVFHARDGRGRVQGWLVDGVGSPATVEEIEVTVGSVRHVRGRVQVDGETAVLVDPQKIHRG